MTLATMPILTPTRPDRFAAEERDSYLSPRPTLTAHEVVRAIVDQHPGEREIPALVAMVLAQIPSDHRSRQQALQQLLAAEIRRCISGAEAGATDETGMEVAPDGDDDQVGAMKPTKRSTPGYHRGPNTTPAGATTSAKWEAAAAVTNDPLLAQVYCAGVWRTWRELSAENLRFMARTDEGQATNLLARAMKLVALADDMDAAGAQQLGQLPDAAAHIEALPC